jgi:hypothetical protein
MVSLTCSPFDEVWRFEATESHRLTRKAVAHLRIPAYVSHDDEGVEHGLLQVEVMALRRHGSI